MSDAVKISVLRKSQPVDLETGEDQIVRYYVKEWTGSQRDEYFNKYSSKMKTGEGGEIVGLKDYKGLYSTLLAYCVYDSSHKLVPESQIQDWPDAAQKALFEIAKDINGLNKEDSEKKDD